VVTQPRAAALKVVDASLPEMLRLRPTKHFKTRRLPPYMNGYLVEQYAAKVMESSEKRTYFTLAPLPPTDYPKGILSGESAERMSAIG